MHKKNPNIDYELVVKYLSNEAQEEEIRMLDSWIAESDANKTEFDRMKSIWEETLDYQITEPSAVDALGAWEKLKFRIDRENEEPKILLEPEVRKPSRTLFYYGIAAAVLLLLGFIYIFSSIDRDVVLLQADQTIVQDTLPDGSAVALNEGSSIKYREKSRQRLVDFSGEAFFVVEKDITRPFVIQAKDAQVLVTGTSFNLRAFPELDTVELSMETGQAYLINGEGTDSLLVSAGQKGMLLKKSRKLQLLETDPANDTFWLTRTLIFKKTALSAVFALLQETFKTEIVVEDSLILDCRLSARYRDTSLEGILEQIAKVFELTVSKTEDRYEIAGGSCE